MGYGLCNSDLLVRDVTHIRAHVDPNIDGPTAESIVDYCQQRRIKTSSYIQLKPMSDVVAQDMCVRLGTQKLS